MRVGSQRDQKNRGDQAVKDEGQVLLFVILCIWLIWDCFGRLLDTPTNENQNDAATIRGEFRGIRRAIDALNERMNDNEFPRMKK
jgi:hypothetical protein